MRREMLEMKGHVAPVSTGRVNPMGFARKKIRRAARTKPNGASLREGMYNQVIKPLMKKEDMNHERTKTFSSVSVGTLSVIFVFCVHHMVWRRDIAGHELEKIGQARVDVENHSSFNSYTCHYNRLNIRVDTCLY